MGDQLRFVDDSGDTRLAGELVDDGATVGDVLTVQSDGSLAAAPGGGSMPYTFSCTVVTNGGGSSPECEIVVGSGQMVGTVTTIPFAIAAGQDITAGQRAYLPDELPTGGVLALDYLEVAVSNMDGTEYIVASPANPNPDLTPDQNDFTDIASTFGAGTDLTVNGANIKTTAGGVFVVQFTVEFVWTPT